jgi:hypothetical protein
MRTEYIVVLEFSTTTVKIFPFDSSMFESVEEYFEKLEDETGYEIDLNNCQYMVTEQLNIDII